MAMTNAEKQARWRERHIAKRRNAQRIANLLMRKRYTDEHIKEVAGLLNTFFNRNGARILRRHLRAISDPPTSDKAKREHNARVYEQLRVASEVMKGEQEAWERDHPGQKFPEYECGLTDRESTDLERWRRRRERKHKELVSGHD